MKYVLEYEASCPGLGKSRGKTMFTAENDGAAEREVADVLFGLYSSSQWRHMGSSSSDWKPLLLSRVSPLKDFA
ncbi:hypothetical protein A2225_02385 [Candidatus Nomurabacteria bacterium RIFOXYA2_FULL_42_12]|uniref:Uncharacterized protein n=1 Tax=Candidatus Nomurabacteria bacterium RIFOXYA2_FULL_42_12 TaxID=1801801 RepID=A0A1F6YMT2_9BACT|nr:MAG: hypothetical protein A2225_02385 [Candidatus Nomurabacteria bacterium RIFOXYA2_FULL_42_12]